MISSVNITFHVPGYHFPVTNGRLKNFFAVLKNAPDHTMSGWQNESRCYVSTSAEMTTVSPLDRDLREIDIENSVSSSANLLVSYKVKVETYTTITLSILRNPLNKTNRCIRVARYIFGVCGYPRFRADLKWRLSFEYNHSNTLYCMYIVLNINE